MGPIKVVGLTGGIACGKSSVADILRKFEVPIIDADEIAHQIMEPGNQAYSLIVQEFGPKILNGDGTINRQVLGDRVFGDSNARQKLELLTHPIIIRRIKELIADFALTNTKLLVVEVPLLFETGMEKFFDAIWVVSTKPDFQLKRLMQRNGLSKEQAVQRLANQLPLSYKESKADKIIFNNSEFKDLTKEVQHIIETIKY